MRLPFELEAVAELEATAAYYERERPGCGEAFLAEVSSKVARAALFPQSGRRVAGAPSERDVHVFSLSRFPVSVVTAIVNGQRAVVAIAHMGRAPGYWREPLP